MDWNHAHTHAARRLPDPPAPLLLKTCWRLRAPSGQALPPFDSDATQKSALRAPNERASDASAREVARIHRERALHSARTDRGS